MALWIRYLPGNTTSGVRLRYRYPFQYLRAFLVLRAICDPWPMYLAVLRNYLLRIDSMLCWWLLRRVSIDSLNVVFVTTVNRHQINTCVVSDLISNVFTDIFQHSSYWSCHRSRPSTKNFRISMHAPFQSHFAHPRPSAGGSDRVVWVLLRCDWARPISIAHKRSSREIWYAPTSPSPIHAAQTSINSSSGPTVGVAPGEIHIKDVTFLDEIYAPASWNWEKYSLQTRTLRVLLSIGGAITNDLC